MFWIIHHRRRLTVPIAPTVGEFINMRIADDYFFIDNKAIVGLSNLALTPQFYFVTSVAVNE